MNTPITDAAIKDYIAHGQPDRTFGKPMARLELDRAALMEALENLAKVLVIVAGDKAPVPRIALECTNKVLSAARANFPTE